MKSPILILLFYIVARISGQDQIESTTISIPIEESTTINLSNGDVESTTVIEEEGNPDDQEGINPLILQMGLKQEQDCGPNEVLNDCASLDCEFKCGDEEEICDPTAIVCFAPQCQCEMGYRRTAYGKCVLRELCD